MYAGNWQFNSIMIGEVLGFTRGVPLVSVSQNREAAEETAEELHYSRTYSLPYCSRIQVYARVVLKTSNVSRFVVVFVSWSLMIPALRAGRPMVLSACPSYCQDQTPLVTG